MRPLILLGLIVAAGSGSTVGAQTTAGRISGVVQDQTGATVPDAKVTATNLETGLTRESVTRTEGVYVLYPLAPGTYQLAVERSGFETLHIEDLRVEVGATIVRNLALQVSGVRQEITVSGAPPLRHTISVESTITREQIDALPFAGRDFNQLVLLAPGAVDNSVGGGTDFGAVAVNGNRSYSNDYLLDGIPNNNVFQGRSGAPVSVDVIREFKVTSGIAAAEFGQAGTQVSVVTRSGTNTNHGGVFEYFRGTIGQARDPFNTMTPQPFRRDQFGGSFGGPLRVPGYDGRNRTFCFGNYEGYRQRRHVTRFSSVPPDAFWRGNFSELLPRIQLRDPLIAGRPVIPNNRLDLYLGGARITSTAIKFRPLMPTPNLPGLGNNLLLFPEDWRNLDQFTARVDHTLNARQGLAARYTLSHEPFFEPNLIGVEGAGKDESNNSRNGSLAWTATWGARTVNELRVGTSHFADVITYRNDGLPTVESLGLRGFEPWEATVPPLPRIVFSSDGFSEIKSGPSNGFGEANLQLIDDTWSLSEVLTHTRAKHLLKMGIETRRIRLDVNQYSEGRGRLSFSGSTTATRSSGYSFSDFLMGLPSSTREVPLKPNVILRQMELASFIQDDWRPSPRLTISLGLRHEVYQNPDEERNRLAIFDGRTAAIVVASNDGVLPVNEYLQRVVQKVIDAGGRFTFPVLSDQQAGLAPRRLLDTKWYYFGPRAGFVYLLDAESQMIARGGYGMFYSRYPRQYLLNTIALNPPFSGVFNYTETVTAGIPSVTTEVPFLDTLATGATISPGGLDREFRLPYNQQWQLTLERDLGRSIAGSLGYVGNRGGRLFRSVNANAARYDPATNTVQRPLASSFGTNAVALRTSDGMSMYHALQVEVRRRSTRGVGFDASWTWASGIDDVGTTLTSNLLDVENLGRDRAFSDYVRRHNIKASAMYELPFGKGRRHVSHAPPWADAIVGGWAVNGTWVYTTGRSFTPSFSGSSGIGNNRPDRVPGVSIEAPGGSTPDHWFNPAAFSEVPAVDPALGVPRFGNAGRNVIPGPSNSVMNANAAKRVRLTRGRSLQLRVESFNLLNHANYGAPDANISNVNTVGTINTIFGSMRQVQFAVRYEF